MPFIKGKQLAQNLETLLRESNNITILQTGNPLHFRMSDRDYYVYLKCVSYAGNPYPENTTRAQLPQQEVFNEIKEGDACFMFWGYDIENDLYVCWDPQKVKSRLNVKTYVSFFSRKNIQESVRIGEVKIAELTNGDRYVLFKKNDTIYFLEHLNEFFTQTLSQKKEMDNKDISIFQNTEEGILSDVRYDASVKLLIDEILFSDSQTSVLQILSKCFAEFGEIYNKMGLKDWSRIVNKYKKEFESEQQDNEDDATYDTTSTIISFNYVENKADFIEGTDSRDVAERIMKEMYAETRKSVVCEGRINSCFPQIVMEYLSNNDNLIYNKIVSTFTLHDFIQGHVVSAYKYKDENIEIPRFFLPVHYYSGLTQNNKNRWIPNVFFSIQGVKCFISNQWVGHNTEEKSNLRINDFAYMIYKMTNKSYYINFIPDGRKYNMQLVHVTFNQSVVHQEHRAG